MPIDILQALKEQREAVQFKSPTSLKPIVGEFLFAYPPSVDDRIKAAEACTFTFKGAKKKKGENDQESLMRQIFAYEMADKAYQIQFRANLVGACVFYQDKDGEKFPISPEVAKGVDESTLFTLLEAVERAQDLIDPPVEVLTNEELQIFRDSIKKNYQESPTGNFWKNIDSDLLRSFALTMAKELSS